MLQHVRETSGKNIMLCDKSAIECNCIVCGANYAVSFIGQFLFIHVRMFLIVDTCYYYCT